MQNERAPSEQPLTSAIVASAIRKDLHEVPSLDVARQDVKRILDGFGLHRIRRFLNQKYWEAESYEATSADKIENGLRLESVAEHSWHVADSALLISSNFPSLSLERCLALALLHDKLELLTGDFDPVGKDGTGKKTHAFSQSKQELKRRVELKALKKYISGLPPRAAEHQRNLLEDFVNCKSEEAKFVTAIDKFQAFCYVITKKNGNLEDAHIYFTINYSKKCLEYFPALVNHYHCALDVFLENISRYRNIGRNKLEDELFSQYEIQL